MSNDLATLAQVLANTLNADGGVRGTAEAQLKEFEKVPGSHGTLLQLLSLPDTTIPHDVKQSAALRLKNLYQGYASIQEGELCRITPLDRQLVKAQLLDAIIAQSNEQIRIQLVTVIFYLWPTNTPSDWPELIPAIVANLQRGMQSSPPDMLRIYNCLRTFFMVVKNYQFRSAEARGPIFEMVDATFPLLLPIFQTMAGLGTNATDETREICRVIIKIYCQVSTLSIPPKYLENFNLCVPWFDTLIHILETPIPGLESITGVTNELHARERLRVSPGWRCRKWICRIFLRIFSRYGRVNFVGEGGKKGTPEAKLKKAWAQQFHTQYSFKILGSIMNLLKTKTQGMFLSAAVLHQGLSYLATAVESSEHWKLLKPHLPFLIQEVILQTYMLTPNDLALWKTDPHEFVRIAHDLMHEFQDPRIAATGLLHSLISFRTNPSLQLALTTIQQVFEQYQNADASSKNPLLKEGAMRMFVEIRRLIMSDKNLRDGIENIIIQHVLPEFQSPHGFLRLRACAILGEYYKLQWKNKQAQQHAIQLCLERLSDTELPVQMEAWTACSQIIEIDSVKDMLQPHIGLMIKAFHNLFDEIGNDAVVGVLGTLVENFQEAVLPYAVDLVNRLAELYIGLQAQISEQPDDYDEDNDTEATASQCLQSISAVVYACQTRPELYPQFLPACKAVLDISINDKMIECYEIVLDLYSALIYYPSDQPIPDDMWKYLPPIIASFSTPFKIPIEYARTKPDEDDGPPAGWGESFLKNMLPIFDTALVKGGALLITPQGQPLLLGMFNIAKHVLKDQKRLFDARFACVLVESILANLRGQVDVLIPEIAGLSCERLLTIVKKEEEAAAEKKRRQQQQFMLQTGKNKKGGIAKKNKDKSAKFKADDPEDEFESEELKGLKIGLLNNIGICCHYNPILFCQFFASQPEHWAGRLFNVWLSYVGGMDDDFEISKFAVLGLSSLVAIPIAALPPIWREGLPGVLHVLMTCLSKMSDILAEQDAEEEERKLNGETEPKVSDDTNDSLLHNVDDDRDVFDPEAGNVDLDDDDEEIDHELVRQMEEGYGDEGDVDRFESPLDDIDAFVFFAQAVQTLSQQEPAFYQQWFQSIGPEGQALLQKHGAQATKHQREMEEEKAAELAKKAAGNH